MTRFDKDQSKQASTARPARDLFIVRAVTRYYWCATGFGELAAARRRRRRCDSDRAFTAILYMILMFVFICVLGVDSRALSLIPAMIGRSSLWTVLLLFVVGARFEARHGHYLWVML